MDLTQHDIDLFTSTLGPCFSDVDRLIMFERAMERCGHLTGPRFVPMLGRFLDYDPELYRDAAAPYIEKCDSDDVKLLFRQVDDEEIDDEAVGRSLDTVFNKPLENWKLSHNIRATLLALGYASYVRPNARSASDPFEIFLISFLDPGP